MNEQEMGAALLSLTKAMAAEMRTKANTANFNTAGLLTSRVVCSPWPGMEPDVITTHIRPMGLGAALPVFPNNVDDPRYGFITGFAATAGSEPTNPCDDAPKGYMKGGTLTAAFGRVMRQPKPSKSTSCFTSNVAQQPTFG